MTRTMPRRPTSALAGADARPLRRRLVLLDQDQADLDRARELLRQAREHAEEAPRDAFELVHRAALRGAGVLVSRANRERRRPLPRNVWSALERLGGDEVSRAEEVAPMVAERARLDRDLSLPPDPALLGRHLECTAAHLDLVAERLLEDLPAPLAELAVEQ